MREAQVVHHVPGRMRIKVPFLKDLSVDPQQVNELLLPIDGLRKVDFSPITGSVLLHYDPEMYEDFSRQLGEYIQTSMGLGLVTAVSRNGSGRLNSGHSGRLATGISDTQLARHIKGLCGQLNQEIRAATDDAADLKSLLPLGLAAIALLNIGSAATTPLWVTLGIFSFTSFAILNTDKVENGKSNLTRRRITSRKLKTSS
jgi:hypothetical protein